MTFSFDFDLFLFFERQQLQIKTPYSYNNNTFTATNPFHLFQNRKSQMLKDILRYKKTYFLQYRSYKYRLHSV